MTLRLCPQTIRPQTTRRQIVPTLRKMKMEKQSMAQVSVGGVFLVKRDDANGCIVETVRGRKRFKKFLHNRKSIENRIFVNRLYSSSNARNRKWEEYVKHLSRGAKRSLTMDNAGGASVRSEALSIDLLEKLYDANNVLCEMEVQYDGHAWSMVDYLITISGKRVGVSVFRAMTGPNVKRTTFSMEDARRLVRKKLCGLIVARNSVSKEHRFFRSVLHCIAQSPHAARMMKMALEEVMETFETNLVAMITIVPKFDDVFYEKRGDGCRVSGIKRSNA